MCFFLHIQVFIIGSEGITGATGQRGRRGKIGATGARGNHGVDGKIKDMVFLKQIALLLINKRVYDCIRKYIIF